MARFPRFNLPGIPQHVIQRGNNRQACFCTKQDYLVYLSKLKEYSQKYNIAVHSYVLMTNHVHLLMTPDEGSGVSRLMQSLGRYYVRYFNHTHDRTGTLWEGRFKSTLVDNTRYFLIVSRYIELNPVRANMVVKPLEYPWSSYQKNATGRSDPLIIPHSCYQLLGETDKARQIAYSTLFSESIQNNILQEIRDATNKQWILGDYQFKKKIEKQAGRRVASIICGGDRRSQSYRERLENQLL